MRILDTHLHLVYQDRFSYPWLERRPAAQPPMDGRSPTSPRPRRSASRRRCTWRSTSPKSDMVAETDFVTALHPGVVGAIAAGRPEHKDFPDYLQRLAEMPGLRASAASCTPRRTNCRQSDLFVENLQRLRRLPAAVRPLRAGRPAADRRASWSAQCPDVQFVLDHCGVPKVAEQELEPWRADIRELAQHPNVAAKISGVVAYARSRLDGRRRSAPSSSTSSTASAGTASSGARTIRSAR